MDEDDIRRLAALSSAVAMGFTTAEFDDIDMDGTPVTKLSCAMENGADGCVGGYARCFGLWAYLRNVTDPALVLVAVADSKLVHFPAYSGDPFDRMQAVVDLSLGGAAFSCIIMGLAYWRANAQNNYLRGVGMGQS